MIDKQKIRQSMKDRKALLKQYLREDAGKYVDEIISNLEEGKTDTQISDYMFQGVFGRINPLGQEIRRQAWDQGVCVYHMENRCTRAAPRRNYFYDRWFNYHGRFWWFLPLFVAWYPIDLAWRTAKKIGLV